MKVITPVVITDAMLTSSTIAEPFAGETAWSAGTAYTLGQIVIRSTTHRKYQNILAGTDAGLPEITPTRWVEVGVTNKLAMFDTLRNTQSITSTSPLTVVLTPSARVDSLALLSVEADTVTITITNGIETVYSASQNLSRREVLEWYDYYFEKFTFIPNIVKFDIPPYSTGVITITFTAVSPIKVGAIVIGNQQDLGKAVYGVLSEELNFSRIDRQVTGESILLPRRSIPKINIQTFADKKLTNKIRDTRRDLNAVPSVWSGLDDKIDNAYFETVLLLGVYKQFKIDVSQPDRVGISLEIEEI